MSKFVVSIRPGTNLSPQMLESILGELGPIYILDGVGERTMTIASEMENLSQLITARIPQVTLRPYRSLHLL